MKILLKGNTDENINGQGDSAEAANSPVNSPANTSANSTSNTSNGQFKCPAIGCERVFATAQKLVRHKKFKCNQSKIFKCGRCQQAFQLNIMLRKHICSGGSANRSNVNSTRNATGSNATST